VHNANSIWRHLVEHTVLIEAQPPEIGLTKGAASFWPRFDGQRSYPAGDMSSSFGIRNAQRPIGVHSCGQPDDG
jgi:hypothetical protein